ncbi:proteophosphoglycan ppg4 [Rhodotorula toruloides]|uniref:Proteophosphoglycan ppg4 n=1 Tax=Rhodotorula toruloides TaxID=5286 RepID=A0A511KN29_RHOTO|nr:proteophosphoglycan ppg4 [Rhodotorula toruloides]
MLGLLSRATANLKNSQHPAGWSPDDPAPSGFSSHKSSFSLPISSLATFSFRATGNYSQGTIVFERTEGVRRAVDPPSYGEALHESGKPREVGAVEVQVEARTNSEGLYGDSRIEPVEGHERCGLSLTTPASSSVSRLGATLSYHIVVAIPGTLTSLDSLVVEATGFRVVLSPSLASLPLSNLKISTTDAPILLHNLRAEDIKVRNANLLDPNKRELKNFDDLISGSVASSSRIQFECENGPISGSFRSTGALIVHTTNFPVKGDFHGSSLRIATTNSEISGMFDAQRDIAIQNVHGNVEGKFRAPTGCEIKGQYNAINGSFEVGNELKLITTVFRIDATVRLLPPPSSSLSTSAHPSLPVTRIASATSSTNELPTFEDAMASSASSSSFGVVNVVAETTDAAIELAYEEQPREVALRSLARTSGGSKVVVRHPQNWEGSFSVSTVLTHTAAFTALSTTSPTLGTRQTSFDTDSRSKVAGSVKWDRGDAGGANNRSVVETDGPAEIVVR